MQFVQGGEEGVSQATTEHDDVKNLTGPTLKTGFRPQSLRQLRSLRSFLIKAVLAATALSSSGANITQVY